MLDYARENAWTVLTRSTTIGMALDKPDIWKQLAEIALHETKSYSSAASKRTNRSVGDVIVVDDIKRRRTQASLARATSAYGQGATSGHSTGIGDTPSTRQSQIWSPFRPKLDNGDY